MVVEGYTDLHALANAGLGSSKVIKPQVKSELKILFGEFLTLNELEQVIFF